MVVMGFDHGKWTGVLEELNHGKINVWIGLL